MSHYKPYASYKSSGVEWVGEVPGHWIAGRFSRVMAGIKDGTHGSFQRLSDGKPLLSAKNVANGFIEISDDESLISNADHNEIVASGYPVLGDLLLTIVGSIGRACVYPFEEPVAFQRSVCFIRLSPLAEPKFFYYFTQSKFFQEQLQSKSKSSAQSGIYMGDISAMAIAYPLGKAEQCEIVAHLDRETARIDGLVSKKTCFIELLREKRQALITHAVTKGLDPNVKMKDSGVEWLGQVPAHWDVSPVKYLAIPKAGAIKTGPFGSQLTSAEMQRGTVKVYNQRNVIDGDLTSGENYITEEKFHQLASFQVFPGDVLITTRGTIGKVAIVSNEAEIGILHPCLMRVQVDETKIRKEFFVCLLGDSHLLQAQIVYLSNASTIEVIYSETMASIVVPVPPVNEQSDILDYLDQEITRLDMIINKTERSIELLKERRSALITAAVTGQIDLREAA